MSNVLRLRVRLGILYWASFYLCLVWALFLYMAIGRQAMPPKWLSRMIGVELEQTRADLLGIPRVSRTRLGRWLDRRALRGRLAALLRIANDQTASFETRVYCLSQAIFVQRGLRALRSRP
jgi:hypothetical protein